MIPGGPDTYAQRGNRSMGRLHVTQIEARLNSTVGPHIDVADLSSQTGSQLRQMRNTRGLAAFVAMRFGDLSPEDAAAAVTDGSGDNGIDTIAILEPEKQMIVVQAKWSDEGRGSASLSDMLKFRDGLDDLVQFKWENFNEKVRERKREIESLLLNPAVQIHVIFAHMGTGELASDVRSRMDQYLRDLNDPTETATFAYFDQARLHRLLLAETRGNNIDLSVELSDWGQSEGPPRAIYGQVPASEIARWVTDYGQPLFAKNVRVLLPDSEVNEGLLTTLEHSPESFWYFNNGITVLCNEIAKAPAGGSDRRQGSFEFRGSSIVNGAQTAGSLARAQDSVFSAQLERAQVMVRFISLEGATDDFASNVTRATNTQNRIGGRDFVSLDPEQARIKDEFAVENLHYVYRSGEADPKPEEGCGIVQATVALACSNTNPALATQAKREISRLWDDITRAPYKQLFNAQTTYLRVWRTVRVLRVVEAALESITNTMDGREKLIAVHGNRAVLHLVFQDLRMDGIEDPHFNWEVEEARAKALVGPTLATVVTVVEDEFPGYPASLFKNATKVAALVSCCRQHDPRPPELDQPGLF